MFIGQNVSLLYHSLKKHDSLWLGINASRAGSDESVPRKGIGVLDLIKNTKCIVKVSKGRKVNDSTVNKQRFVLLRQRGTESLSVNLFKL